MSARARFRSETRTEAWDHDVRTGPDHGHQREMIEAHYGTPIDTAHDAILMRLDGFGA